MALKKVDGVSSVNVTLKRGVAHIALDAGNSVSLPQLRGIIKDAGYTTRDAVVTARGTVTQRGGRLVLDVTGTSTSLVLAEDPAAPEAIGAARRAVTASAQVPADVVGTVAAPAGEKNDKQDDTLLVRSFTTSR